MVKIYNKLNETCNENSVFVYIFLFSNSFSTIQIRMTELNDILSGGGGGECAFHVFLDCVKFPDEKRSCRASTPFSGDHMGVFTISRSAQNRTPSHISHTYSTGEYPCEFE